MAREHVCRICTMSVMVMSMLLGCTPESNTTTDSGLVDAKAPPASEPAVVTGDDIQLKDRITELEQQLERFQDASITASSLNDRIKELEVNITDLVAQNSELESQLDQKFDSANNDDLNITISKLDNENRELSSQLENIQQIHHDDKASWAAELQECVSQRNAIEIQLSDALVERDDAQSRANETEQQVVSLMSQLESIDSEPNTTSNESNPTGTN